MISNVRRYSIFLLAAFFVFYDIFIQISPGSLTHQLMQDLHIDASGLGMLSGIYFYTYLIMQIPAGLLYDRYPTRYVMFFPLLCTLVGALLFALSHTLLLASIARLLIGFGTAFAFISVAKVSADLFPKKYFPILIGTGYIFASLGGVAAQICLSRLLQVLAWRDSMLVIFAAGVIFALLIWVTVRYKVSQANSAAKFSDHNVFHSLKLVVRHPQSWFIGIVSLCTWGPMAIFASLWAIPFLMTTYHFDKTQAAEIASFTWIGLAVISPLLGFLSNCCHSRKWTVFVACVVGLVSILFITYDTNLPKSVLIVLLFLLGGACSAQPLSYTLVREHHEQHIVATAISFNNMAAIIAGAVFQPISGFLINQHHTASAGTYYSVSDYQHGLIVVPIFFALSIIVTVFFINEPKRN